MQPQPSTPSLQTRILNSMTTIEFKLIAHSSDPQRFLGFDMIVKTGDHVSIVELHGFAFGTFVMMQLRELINAINKGTEYEIDLIGEPINVKRHGKSALMKVTKQAFVVKVSHCILPETFSTTVSVPLDSVKPSLVSALEGLFGHCYSYMNETPNGQIVSRLLQ